MSCCKGCIIHRVLQAISSVQSSLFPFPFSIKKHMLSLFTDFFNLFFLLYLTMETIPNSDNTIWASVASSNFGTISTSATECSFFFFLIYHVYQIFCTYHCKVAANIKCALFFSLKIIALWYLKPQWQLVLLFLKLSPVENWPWMRHLWDINV